MGVCYDHDDHSRRRMVQWAHLFLVPPSGLGLRDPVDGGLHKEM
jgi:hypothetical protein